MKVEFSKSAFRQFSKLPKEIQKRISNKIDFYINQKNPIIFAEMLTDSDLGDFRFRIGDYRIIFDFYKDTIYVLKIGHRKDIYR
jgi:mRNA interferase RelE/StbE